MKITDFFKNDYVNQASYDNLRKIASVIDGQKNAARKVLWVTLRANIDSKLKVSQYSSKVAEQSQYLHGSLDGIIVNLAKSYSGTNNIPLLSKDGNFGNRQHPNASASRYIYSYGSEELFKFFRKEDLDILIKQEFEGSEIEPLFFVPSLPFLLINGSNGVSSGFAQDILPRNSDEIKEYLKNYLTGGNKTFNLHPYFKDFKGKVEAGESNGQWKIYGDCKITGMNKVLVEEIPVYYDLHKYILILDKLEETGVIQGYTDKTDNGKFLFEIQIHSKTLKDISHQELLEKLKLVLTLTENYTTLDENNKIRVFENPHEMIKYYIEVKMNFLLKRKLDQIEKLNNSYNINISRYEFIKAIIEDRLIINKRQKNDIVNDIEKIPNIIKYNDSYDYLLNMNIISLSYERLEKLKLETQIIQNDLNKLKIKTLEEIWLDDIN